MANLTHKHYNVNHPLSSQSLRLVDTISILLFLKQWVTGLTEGDSTPCVCFSKKTITTFIFIWYIINTIK